MHIGRLLTNIAVHGLASVGLGASFVLQVFGPSDTVWENWSSHVGLMLRNLDRHPHGIYIAAATVCMALVPVLAGWRDAAPVPPRWKCVEAFLVTSVAPVAYFIATFAFYPFLRGDMTAYASMTVNTFMPLVLSLWALLAIPMTLAASALLARWRRRR